MANDDIELSVSGFKQWFKHINIGHKRLWFVFSIPWFSYFVIASFIQFVNKVAYCKENPYYPYTESACIATYQYMAIVWAVSIPVAILLIGFIAAWVRTGYKINNGK